MPSESSAGQRERVAGILYYIEEGRYWTFPTGIVREEEKRNSSSGYHEKAIEPQT
jgi:hypothetical protein